jgi:iron-sulfur cluster assembly protein
MLTMTDRAATTIEDILHQSQAGPEGGVRISGAADPGGDAALEFALASGPIEGDEVVRERGAVLYLDETAAAALDDKLLDIEAHGDHLHFSLEQQDAGAG